MNKQEEEYHMAKQYNKLDKLDGEPQKQKTASGAIYNYLSKKGDVKNLPESEQAFVEKMQSNEKMANAVYGYLSKQPDVKNLPGDFDKFKSYFGGGTEDKPTEVTRDDVEGEPFVDVSQGLGYSYEGSEGVQPPTKRKIPIFGAAPPEPIAAVARLNKAQERIDKAVDEALVSGRIKQGYMDASGKNPYEFYLNGASFDNTTTKTLRKKGFSREQISLAENDLKQEGAAELSNRAMVSAINSYSENYPDLSPGAVINAIYGDAIVEGESIAESTYSEELVNLEKEIRETRGKLRDNPSDISLKRKLKKLSDERKKMGVTFIDPLTGNKKIDSGEKEEDARLYSNIEKQIEQEYQLLFGDSRPDEEKLREDYINTWLRMKALRYGVKGPSLDPDEIYIKTLDEYSPFKTLIGVPDEHKKKVELYKRAHARWQALAKLYLGNVSPEEVEKDAEYYITNIARQAVRSFLPSSAKSGLFLPGQSEREYVESLSRDIAGSKVGFSQDELDKIEGSWGENFGEQATDFGGMLIGDLPKLYVLGKGTNWLRGGELYKKTIGNLAKSNNKVKKVTGVVLDGMLEEAATRTAGFPEHSGFGMRIGHAVMPRIRLKGKLGTVLQPFVDQAWVRGVSATTAMEIGGISNAAGEALFNDADFKAIMDSQFGDASESTTRVLAEILANSMLMGTSSLTTEKAFSPRYRLRLRRDIKEASEDLRQKGLEQEADAMMDVYKKYSVPKAEKALLQKDEALAREFEQRVYERRKEINREEQLTEETRSEQPKKEVKEEPVEERGPIDDVINRRARVKKVGDMELDKPVEGEMYVEGQTVIVERGNTKRELGNITELRRKSLSELGIEPIESNVKVNRDGTFDYNGETLIPRSENPTKAINYNKKGGVNGVVMRTPDGKKTRTLRGQDAVDAAYQILLKRAESPQQRERVNKKLEENYERELREAEEAAKKKADTDTQRSEREIGERRERQPEEQKIEEQTDAIQEQKTKEMDVRQQTKAGEKVEQKVREQGEEVEPYTSTEGVRVEVRDGEPVAVKKDGNPYKVQNQGKVKRALLEYRFKKSPTKRAKEANEANEEFKKTLSEELFKVSGSLKATGEKREKVDVDRVLKAATRAIEKNIALMSENAFNTFKDFYPEVTSLIPEMKTLPKKLIENIYRREIKDENIDVYNKEQLVKDLTSPSLKKQQQDLLERVAEDKLIREVPKDLRDRANKFLQGFKKGQDFKESEMTKKQKENLKDFKAQVKDIISKNNKLLNKAEGVDVKKLVNQVAEASNPRQMNKAIERINGIIENIEAKREIADKNSLISDIARRIGNFKTKVKTGDKRHGFKISPVAGYSRQVGEVIDSYKSAVKMQRENYRKYKEEGFSEADAIGKAKDDARIEFAARIENAQSKIEKEMAENVDYNSELLAGKFQALKEFRDIYEASASKTREIYEQFKESMKEGKSADREMIKNRLEDFKNNEVRPGVELGKEALGEKYYRNNNPREGRMHKFYDNMTNKFNFRGWLGEIGVKMVAKAEKDAVGQGKDPFTMHFYDKAKGSISASEKKHYELDVESTARMDEILRKAFANDLVGKEGTMYERLRVAEKHKGYYNRERTGVFLYDVNGNSTELIATKGEALYFIAASRDPHLRRALFTPQEVVGSGRQKGNGLTEEGIKRLEEYVGKEGMTLLEGLLDNIQYWGKMWNNKHIEQTGRSLFPVESGYVIPGVKEGSVRSKSDAEIARNLNRPSVSSKHMLTRVDRHMALDKKSIFEIHNRYVNDAKRYIAFSDMVKMFNAVFTNPEIERGLKNRYGSNFAREWQWLVNNTTGSNLVEKGLLDIISRPFRKGALFFSVPVAMKQLISTTYYYNYMSPGQSALFTKDVPILAGTAVANWASKKATGERLKDTNSEVLDLVFNHWWAQKRKKGFAVELSEDYIFNSNEMKAISEDKTLWNTWRKYKRGKIDPKSKEASRMFDKMGGVLLKLGDNFPVTIGGAAFVKQRYKGATGRDITAKEIREYREGKENEALDKAMADWYRVAEITQQSLNKSNQARMRVQTPLARSLFSFTSGPFQIWLNKRYERRSIAPYVEAGEIGKAAKSAARYSMYGLISPMLYKLLDNKGRIKEDEEIWGMAKGLLVEGVPVVGQFGNMAYNVFLDKPWAGGELQGPGVGGIYNLLESGARVGEMAFDPVYTDEEREDAYIDFSSSLLQIRGVNAPKLIIFYDNYKEFFDDEKDDRFLFWKAIGVNTDYISGKPTFQYKVFKDTPLKGETEEEYLYRVENLVNAQQGEEMRLDFEDKKTVDVYKALYNARQDDAKWAEAYIRRFNKTIYDFPDTFGVSNPAKINKLAKRAEKQGRKIIDLLKDLHNYGYTVSHDMIKLARRYDRGDYDLDKEIERERLRE